MRTFVLETDQPLGRRLRVLLHEPGFHHCLPELMSLVSIASAESVASGDSTDRVRGVSPRPVLIGDLICCCMNDMVQEHELLRRRRRAWVAPAGSGGSQPRGTVERPTKTEGVLVSRCGLGGGDQTACACWLGARPRGSDCAEALTEGDSVYDGSAGTSPATDVRGLGMRGSGSAEHFDCLILFTDRGPAWWSNAFMGQIDRALASFASVVSARTHEDSFKGDAGNYDSEKRSGVEGCVTVALLMAAVANEGHNLEL